MNFTRIGVLVGVACATFEVGAAHAIGGLKGNARGALPQPELPCDGIDQDGDGSDACETDDDGDGVPVSFDCDDGDPTVHPLQTEIRCNGKDENCDGRDDCDADDDGVLDHLDCDPTDPSSTRECFGVPPPEPLH